MVLTNLEIWAADGSSGHGLSFDSNNPHTRQLNPFDPRVVPQLNPNLNHLSSNGYYGFSYVNAIHDNNNNDNMYLNNMNNNNNNSTTCNFLQNDVNGMKNVFTPSTQQQTHVSSANFNSSAYPAGLAVNTVRCKKRFFVMNDVKDDCTNTNKTKGYYNCEISAKRCRFDNDFSAEYCNDFFQLPSTQIATQSCLMDTEDGFEHKNNKSYKNFEKCEQELSPQLQSLTANDHHHQQQQQQQQQQNQHQQQQASQQQLNSQQQQLQQQQQQQQYLYHQQQHYQGHLHRSNRDVSRCMLSHMI